MKLQPHLLAYLPQERCRALRAVPFALDGSVLSVAVEDADVLGQLTPRLSYLRLSPVVVSARAMEALLAAWPTSSASGPARVNPFARIPISIERCPSTPPVGRLEPIQPHVVDRMVGLIVSQARNDNAWEIQLIPGRGSVDVFYRVDGGWVEVMSPPAHVHGHLVARFREMARLRPGADRGWLSVMLDGEPHHLHLKIVPTARGDLLALEPLQPKEPHGSELPPHFAESLRQDSGLVLVEAPEGHGLRITFGQAMKLLRERRPWGLASWSCAWSDQPVIWAPGGQDAWLENLHAPAPVVLEEVTDAGASLRALAQRTLVVAGVRDAATVDAPSLGILRQRLARCLCRRCAGRGCDPCKGTGIAGSRLLRHWSGDSDTTLEQLITGLEASGEIDADEAARLRS